MTETAVMKESAKALLESVVGILDNKSEATVKKLEEMILGTNFELPVSCGCCGAYGDTYAESVAIALEFIKQLKAEFPGLIKKQRMELFTVIKDYVEYINRKIDSA